MANKYYNNYLIDCNNCWNWIKSKDKYGYGRISYHKKTYKAHRFFWEIYNGNIPDGLCVCHKCDNKSCVNPDHLFLGTHKDNMADMFSKNIRKNPSGIDHYMYGKHVSDDIKLKLSISISMSHYGKHKLSVQDVKDIRQLLSEQYSPKYIMNKYNISDCTLYNIKNKKSWKYI